MFDPYEQWLGIPPAQQPPSFYALLGVRAFETSDAKIHEAANARLQLVRAQAAGEHADAARRIESEIAFAVQVLGVPKSKAAYDAVQRTVHAESAAPVNLPAPPVDGSAKTATQAARTNQPRTRDPQVGDTLGAYRLLECRTTSAVGNTFRAKNQNTGGIVSLKLIKRELARHPELLKRFQREFQVTRKLSHPHLIASFEIGEDDGIHFLSMEFIGGADLAQVVAQQGPLSVEAAVEYVRGAAQALAYLHSEGIYHRNVSPRNLLVNVHGRLKLANLILAKLDDEAALAEMGGGEQLTKQGEILGNVDYLAPEQAVDSSTIDGRADIYSLGCTLHYLLTGKPPYTGKGAMRKLTAHRTEPIPRLQEARQDVPDWLENAFQRMMAKSRDKRMATMDQVVDIFTREGEFSSRQLWTIAAAGAVVVAILVGGMIWLTRF